MRNRCSSLCVVCGTQGSQECDWSMYKCIKDTNHIPKWYQYTRVSLLSVQAGASKVKAVTSFPVVLLFSFNHFTLAPSTGYPTILLAVLLVWVLL